MPTLVSTQTFVQGNVLNADALTNHVVDAKPLATFISGQDAVASPAPAVAIKNSSDGDGAVTAV